MKLNKNTQILLGVGALAIVGYFVMKNNQQPNKANASGGNKGTFQQTYAINCIDSIPNKEWQIVGDFRGSIVYLDMKGIYHWFTKISGKATKRGGEIITYCYENISDGNPIFFTPKK